VSLLQAQVKPQPLALSGVRVQRPSRGEIVIRRDPDPQTRTIYSYQERSYSSLVGSYPAIQRLVETLDLVGVSGTLRLPPQPDLKGLAGAALQDQRAYPGAEIISLISRTTSTATDQARAILGDMIKTGILSQTLRADHYYLSWSTPF
jgi:hypothetical protein